MQPNNALHCVVSSVPHKDILKQEHRVAYWDLSMTKHFVYEIVVKAPAELT